MAQVALSLPADTLAWAEARVAAGEAESIDAYFGALAERDRAEKEDVSWLQAKIDEGLASGVDPRSHEEIWNDLEAKYFGQRGAASL